MSLASEPQLSHLRILQVFGGQKDLSKVAWGAFKGHFKGNCRGEYVKNLKKNEEEKREIREDVRKTRDKTGLLWVRD